jgi:hypothetical protein
VKPPDQGKPKDLRLAALRRFATAITIVNILGHTILGFEPSLAQMFTSLFTAYGVDLLLEWIQARVEGRPARFLGSKIALVNFLLPAHITGLAIGMLLYTNDRLLPFAFAAATGIASKALLTAPLGNGRRHFMNPSNFGLTVTFFTLPDIAMLANPYQFTAELSGYGDWLVPAIVICTGSILNTFFTKRMPLALGWAAGFALQAVVRHFVFDTALLPSLAPMTGMAFLLFSFYMVTDPGTTPSLPSRQVAFGASVALVYGVLFAFQVTLGIFYALTLVAAVRGISLHISHAMKGRAEAAQTAATAPQPEAPPAIAARTAVGDGA